MAGLPQDRPIPGAPLLDPLAQAAPPILPIAPGAPGAPMAPQLPDVDPLTGLPLAPPLEPQGYQFDAAGDPLPFPPDDWFAQPDGQAPAGVQGHEVPIVEDKAAPAPPATTQAGPQGMAALDQARKDGHLIDPYADQPAAPPQAQARGTGDAYLDTVNQAADLRARAAVQQAEAEKQKNAYLSEEGTRIAREQSERQASADKEYQEVTSEAKVKRAQLEQEAKDIANQKMDRNRAWNNMSFGAQLFVGITAALTGATTRSVQTGQNPVLDQINKMVEQDLANQQADIDNRWKGNTQRRGLLADELAAGRDMLDVRYKSLNAAYETAANQAKAYALRFDNPVIDARTATFLADVEEHKAAAGLQYQQAAEARAYARKQDAFNNSIQGGQLGLARRHQAFEEYKFDHPQVAPPKIRDQVALSKEQREIEQDRAGREIHLAKTKKGEVVIGPTPKVAEDVNNAMGNTTSVVQGLRRLKEIRKKNGFTPMGSWGNDDIKEATYIYEDLLAGWSQAKEQGVIRDAEYKRYEKMFGSMTGVLDPTANLDAVEHTMVQGMNNKLQARIGKDVAYWEPEDLAPPSFAADGAPKKVPAPVGLPNDPGARKMTPEEQRFVETGKFTPKGSSADEAGLLDFADGE